MLLVGATLPTPVGPMLALASETALCALEFDSRARHTRLDARLAQFYESPEVTTGANGVHACVEAWLDAYFSGRPADTASISLDARGTAFERRVWATLLTIPIGSTTSYGAIAGQVAGSAAAARAVGLANGANPIALIVPCHRVIGSSGALTGYGGGLDRKSWLLEHEERWWPTATSVSRVGRGGSRQPRLELT